MLMYSEYLVKQSLDLQKILCISYFEPDFKLSAFLDTSLINKVQYNISYFKLYKYEFL